VGEGEGAGAREGWAATMPTAALAIVAGMSERRGRGEVAEGEGVAVKGCLSIAGTSGTAGEHLTKKTPLIFFTVSFRRRNASKPVTVHGCNSPWIGLSLVETGFGFVKIF